MRRAVLVFVLAAVALVGLASPARPASGAGTMKGKVVDSRLFEPLSGICVQADLVKELDGSAPRGRGSYDATTGNGGTYQIPNMVPGQYLVTFRGCGSGKANTRKFASATFRDKDGLVPAAPTGAVDPTEPYAELVRILDGVVTSGIDGRLGPGGTILGRVVDASGRPLAKVCVEARYDVNWPASAPVTTDKDGLYAIKGVLPHDLGAAGQEYSVLVLFTDCSKATRFPPTYLPEPVSFQTPQENVSLADFTPGTDPTSGTNPASCVLPGQADRSTEGTTTSSIRFENYGAVGATVYWLDYSGLRVFYKMLAPSESYTQSTFLTHPWVVVGADNRCLAYAVSNSPSRIVRIF